MAILTITEIATLGQTLVEGQVIPAPQLPGVAEQNIAIGGSSVASAAFNPATRFVMINCDVPCCLAWSLPGVTPTAVTTAQRMGQNETRFVAVSPGGKVAVILTV
jgi:hypothetical protein